MRSYSDVAASPSAPYLLTLSIMAVYASETMYFVRITVFLVNFPLLELYSVVKIYTCSSFHLDAILVFSGSDSLGLFLMSLMWSSIPCDTSTIKKSSRQIINLLLGNWLVLIWEYTVIKVIQVLLCNDV